MRQLDGFQARRATGVFRLPLDRAFVIKGHGTVVTGTAMGAEVGVGQKLRVLPSGAEVRVRSIQVHCGLCRKRRPMPARRAESDRRRKSSISSAATCWPTSASTSLPSRFDAMARNSSRRQARAQEQHSRASVYRHGGDYRARDRARRGRRDRAQRRRPRATGHRRSRSSRSRAIASSSATRPMSRTLGGGIVLNPLGRRVRKPRRGLSRQSTRCSRHSSGADAIEAMIDLQEAFALGAAGSRTDEHSDRRGRSRCSAKRRAS